MEGKVEASPVVPATPPHTHTLTWQEERQLRELCTQNVLRHNGASLQRQLSRSLEASWRRWHGDESAG